MQQSLKISASYLLLGEPIRINKYLELFQPTVKDLAILGSERFGSLAAVWFLKRKELLKEENDETWNMSDFDVYKKFMTYDPLLHKAFCDSVLFFLHKKVEFLKMQNSIFIGELQSGIELTEELFLEIQGVIRLITLQKEEDLKTKNAPRSKRAQEIHDKIVAGQKKLDEFKKEKGVDDLANKVVGLVAHGYGYDEVFNMTLFQFNALIEKVVQVENYTITSMLSPYMDKKHKGKNKHWLE